MSATKYQSTSNTVVIAEGSATKEHVKNINETSTNITRSSIFHDDKKQQQDYQSGDEQSKLLPDDAHAPLPSPYSSRRLTFAIALLSFINFISFSDRFIVPSILNMLKEAFHVQTDSEMGLIQTTYIITYMVVSPFWGYVGDRFNRRIILAAAMLIWGTTSLMSAFVPESMFWLFVVLRAATGIGQACCTIISPALISDLFVGNKRTLGILCFQLGLLLGSGFGYIMSTVMSTTFGHWRPVFLVFPPCIFLSLFGLIFLPDPPRGLAEGAKRVKSTSAWVDVKYLSTVKTYIFTTLGFTALSYVLGASTFWEPTFISSAYFVTGNESQINSIGVIYGIKNCLCGVIGAIMGTILSKVLRKRMGDASDAFGCGIGCLLSSPLLYLFIAFSRYSIVLMWVEGYVCDVLVCFSIVLNQEILLNVVVPNRRAIGTSVTIFFGHLLGDAFSPSLVGAINDAALSKLTSHFGGFNQLIDYTSRQYSLYVMVFVAALSGFFYIMASLFSTEDKARATKLAVTAADEDSS